MEPLRFLKKFFEFSRSLANTPAAVKSPLIVAAKVIKIEKHPNADRLRVVGLDIGDRLVAPVVCGAFNFDVGDMVALALPGATIAQSIHSETHEPFVLEKARIRGLESQGMICAAYELGLGPLSERPEIMVLTSDASPGATFHPPMIKIKSTQ